MVNNPNLFGGEGNQIGSELEQLEAPGGELYLRFHLPSKIELALPATGIREVMHQPPDRITPIPNVSPLLLGTLNLRGQVIWVADLGQFLGDPVALNTTREEIPVIAIEDRETILGLAIDSIGETQWLYKEQLQTANTVADSMASFILGEWFNEKTNKSLQLLDHEKIVRSARWGG